MIFVSVGTNEAHFDRLIEAVAELDVEEEVVIQYGHSSPDAAKTSTLVDFLSFEEMGKTIRRARAFVTHGGVGSIMVALSNGKRPIVVPRRGALREAVDDHQLQVGRRFADAGLVTLVETPKALAEALAHDQAPAAVIPAASSLASDLRLFLQDAIAPPAASVAA